MVSYVQSSSPQGPSPWVRKAPRFRWGFRRDAVRRPADAIRLGLHAGDVVEGLEEAGALTDELLEALERGLLRHQGVDRAAPRKVILSNWQRVEYSNEVADLVTLTQPPPSQSWSSSRVRCPKPSSVRGL
jgi:hypothetical protein